MKRLHHWLRAIFHRRRLEQDLQDELSSHLDMDEQERIQRGESPEEAHYEEKPGLDKIIILSFGAWQRLFGGDPQILDKALTLDDGAYTVVGIMPREFIYPDSQTDFWTPLALPLPGLLGLPVIARLKDDVPISAAAEEAGAIGRSLRGESPNDPVPAGPPRTQLMTAKEELVAPIRLPLLVFVIAVSFVLFVACINVANLFLARAATRNREIAIRVALGAGRARVLRQLLTENFILAFLGGAVGIVLAFAGTRVFTVAGQSLARTDLMRFELAGNAIPRLNEVNMDASVLLFTLALTVVTGILFGVVPALQIGRINTIQKADLHVAGSSKWTFRFLRTAMAIGQISLTMILLLGAGLLIKSFVKLANTNVGYDPSSVLTFKIPQPELNYPQDQLKQKRQNAFAEEVVTRLESVPGIQAAAFTDGLPMVQGFFSWDGPQRTAATPKHEGRMAAVSRDYFRALGIRVIAGRGFNEDDRIATRAAYVINRAAVREYFSGVNPIGKTISGGGGFFLAGKSLVSSTIFDSPVLMLNRCLNSLWTRNT